MLFVSVQNDVSTSITNTTIIGTAYGVGLTNVSTSVPIKLDATDTITGTTVAGVYLTDNLTLNPIGLTDLTTNSYMGAANAIAVALDGVTISAAAGAGVIVETSRTQAVDVTATAMITGTTISGASGSIGLDLEGSLASGCILQGFSALAQGSVAGGASWSALRNRQHHRPEGGRQGPRAGVIAFENDFSSNSSLAIQNTSLTAVVDASGNWWGSATPATVPL